MIIKKEQQNTNQWLEMRKGKITGSKLKDIIVKRGTERKIGFYQLMADRLSLTEEYEDPMERGHRLEDEAIAEFEKLTKKKVEQVGLCISDENENIALSPDGLIKIGKKYKEGIEMKCLSSALHLKGYFEKKVPKEYLEQVYQYFIVNTDLEKLYFVFYDPRVTVKPIHFVEIDREDVEDEIQFAKDYQEQTLKEIEELLLTLF